MQPISCNKMKAVTLSQKALERKSNKPIMEKKRRARINHCLNQLKALILETDNERSRHSKLEKVDILEMTVKYLQALRTYHLHLHQIQQQQQQLHLFQQAAQHLAPASQLQAQALSLTNHLQIRPSPEQSPHQLQMSPTWRPW